MRGTLRKRQNVIANVRGTLRKPEDVIPDVQVEVTGCRITSGMTTHLPGVIPDVHGTIRNPVA